MRRRSNWVEFYNKVHIVSKTINTKANLQYVYIKAT